VRRRRVIIVLAVCVLVGIGAVSFWPGEREPEYNGKKLSEWIEICWEIGLDDSQNLEAQKVVQTIGTNGLQSLLKWAGQGVPVWQIRVAEWCQQFHVDWLEHRVWARNRRNLNAWAALRLFGAGATAAVREVYRIAIDSNLYEVTASAIRFLSEIGPNGVPPLLHVIAEGKGERRVQGIVHIGEIPNVGTNAAAVVAVLMKCLDENDENVAGCAAESLSSVGLETEKIVPALIGRIHDNRPMVRSSVCEALGIWPAIGPRFLTCVVWFPSW
jgi:hypothetical protein